MQAEPTPSLQIPDCLPASRAVASLLPAAGRQVFNPLGHIDFWPRRKPPLPACRKISVQTTNCRESDGSEVYGAPWSCEEILGCYRHEPFHELRLACRLRGLAATGSKPILAQLSWLN